MAHSLSQWRKYHDVRPTSLPSERGTVETLAAAVRDGGCARPVRFLRTVPGGMFRSASAWSTALV
jgi:hypothetical protein